MLVDIWNKKLEAESYWMHGKDNSDWKENTLQVWLAPRLKSLEEATKAEANLKEKYEDPNYNSWCKFMGKKEQR